MEYWKMIFFVCKFFTDLKFVSKNDWIFLFYFYIYIYTYSLLVKEISHLCSTKRGYVLDGHPTTVDEARKIFNNTNSPQQIDIDKLPGNLLKRYLTFIISIAEDTYLNNNVSLRFVVSP